MDKKITKRDVITAICIPIALNILWEKFLRSFFDFIFDIFLALGGSLASSISNALYTQIASGYLVNPSTFAYGILSGLSIGVLAASLISFRRLIKKKQTIDKPAEKEKGCATKKVRKKPDEQRLFNIGVFLLVFTTLLHFTFAFKIDFINTKIISTTNNIEIVSPYISDAEYKMLKSKFHSIQSREDYNALLDELTKIANTHNLELK